jgi:GDSL-like Lipase/Acylhydrolase family
MAAGGMILVMGFEAMARALVLRVVAAIGEPPGAAPRGRPPPRQTRAGGAASPIGFIFSRRVRERELKASLIAAILLASQPAVAAGDVVFLGDSIIAGMDVSAVAPNAVNMGVSGDRTAAILARVDKIPADAAAVVLEGGINDLRRGWWHNQVVPNYQKILARLPHGARIYLVGVLPLDETHLSLRWWFVDNRKIAEVNGNLAALCRTYPNCIVIPPLPALGPNDTVGDGVHPNAAGYAKIASQWRASLRDH